MSDPEDDMLREAIGNTEKEIFSEATGKELPSTEGGLGDRSVEEMGTGLEGDIEPEGEAGVEAATGEEAGDGETGEGKSQQTEDKPPQDPKTGQFVAKTEEGKAPAQTAAERPVDPKAKVPLAELISERKTRQGLEKQLSDEKTARAAEQQQTKSQFDQLNARLDQMLAGRQQPPAEAKPAADANANALPDVFDDPNAFAASLEQRIEMGVTKRFVNADLARTHKAHGDTFMTAYNSLVERAKNDPAAAAEIKKVWTSPTPGDDILSWHRRQEALRVVGDDPTAYAERVRTETRESLLKDPEFLKQVAEHLRSEASGQNGGTPRTVARMPKSLNSAAGGQMGAKANSAASTDGSDRGVFESAFADS